MYTSNIISLYKDENIENLLSNILYGLGGIKNIIAPQQNIVIKPNLVVEKPNNTGATTNPEVIDHLIKEVLKTNPKSITIAESSGIGHSTKRAFRVTGYDKIAQKYNIPLVDLKNDEYRKVDIPNGKAISKVKVASTILKSDFLINVPVLKKHSQTKITAGLKNLKGCISDDEKRRFHSKDLHQCIADLNKAIYPDLTIIDATTCSLAWEEGGQPLKLNTIIAATTPNLVALDIVAAHLINSNPNIIKHIQLSRGYKLGDGNLNNIKFIGNVNINNTILNNKSNSEILNNVISKGACSPCLRNLIISLDKNNSYSNLTSHQLIIGQKLNDSDISNSRKIIGVGDCSRRFVKDKYNISGCPPTSNKILDFLKRIE